MKIAYLSNARFPSERAHAIQILHMCNAFALLGHEVDLLVTNRQTKIKKTPEEYYNTEIHFNIVQLKIVDFAGLVLKTPRFLWTFFYMLQRLSFIVSFFWMLRREKYDVIYGRDEWILWMVNLISKHTKNVWESHEAKHNYPAKKILLKKTPTVVISEGIKETYRELGYQEGQFVVAHDAVDETFFGELVNKQSAREKLDISKEKKVVMYIGGLDRWKGVDTFFRAAEHVSSDIQFVVIGGKEHQISALKIEFPKVLFLGSRAYSELPENQQSADILVIPNTAKNDLSAKYTSPLKLFAHMTSSVPLLLSDIPSLRIVLDDTEASFFCADEPTSLAGQVQFIFANYEDALRRAQKAQQKSKEYTWNKRAEKILNFLNK